MALRPTLLKLQQLDLELDAARETLKRLDDGATAELDASLAAIRSQSSAAAAAVTAAKLEAKRLELEASGADAQVKSIESKLYDGSCGSRELTQLQAKLSEARQARTRLEDQLLELMCRIDADEERAARLESTAGQQESMLAAERESNAVARKQVEAAIAELSARRAQLVELVGASAMARYERVRSSCRGLAVVELEGNCCSGCRVALPEDFVAKVARGGDALFTCENCGRILV